MVQRSILPDSNTSHRNLRSRFCQAQPANDPWIVPGSRAPQDITVLVLLTLGSSRRNRHSEQRSDRLHLQAVIVVV